MSLFNEFMKVEDILSESDDDYVYAIVLEDGGAYKLLAVYKKELGAENVAERCMNSEQWGSVMVKELHRNDIKQMKYHPDANLFRKKYTLLGDVQINESEENIDMDTIQVYINSYLGDDSKLVSVSQQDENDFSIHNTDMTEYSSKLEDKEELTKFVRYLRNIFKNVKIQGILSNNGNYITIEKEKQLEEKTQTSNYEIYHDTYSSAISAAIEHGKEQGYEFDSDEVFSITGIMNSRPKNGETISMTVPLYKDGKEVKKALHIQVYDMQNGKYELNCYIL